MEARSQLRHRPTCYRDATLPLSLLGLDSSIGSWLGKTVGTKVEMFAMPPGNGNDIELEKVADSMVLTESQP